MAGRRAGRREGWKMGDVAAVVTREMTGVAFFKIEPLQKDILRKDENENKSIMSSCLITLRYTIERKILLFSLSLSLSLSLSQRRDKV
jgi:hypothetical protein